MVPVPIEPTIQLTFNIFGISIIVFIITLIMAAILYLIPTGVKD